MQKKFEKLFEKEDIEKILKLINKNFQKDNEEELLENIEYIDKLCITIKEKRWIFSKEIIDILFSNIKNNYWRVRQDIIILIAKIIEMFTQEFIQFDLDQIINTLKERFISDDDEDNRYHSLQAIGKIGLLVPNKCLQFLLNQLFDPNPKIQIYSILALTEIASKNLGEIKEILPFLIESYDKEQNDANVSKILGKSIKKISEYLYKEKIADFMTTEQISCPFCNEFYPSTSNICTNCGKPVVRCSICGQKLQHEYEMIKCPFCKTYFHKNHLLTWVRAHNDCPSCLRSLFEDDLK